MKSPRVLHVVLKGDGLTEVVAEDINIGMIEGGAHVTMVYLRDREGSLPKTNASRAVGLGLTSRFPLLFDWLASRRLRRLLSEGSYDVIISHRYRPCLILMRMVKDFPGVHFVNVVHGTGHYNKPSRKRAILRLAHERFRFVCVSDAVADFIRNRCGIGQSPSPVEVIPNGIDIKALDELQVGREAARRELGLDPELLWIGFAGRLVQIKGVVELVEGFSAIADKFPYVKLAILGKGELCAELQALITAKGLQGRVHLLGQVPQARRFFKAFDAFILPSYREGMSIALLEAMATGLPVLVSDIPMNTALVDKDAIVFEPKNSAALAAAMMTFLTTGEADRAAHGAQNRRRAEENYNLQLFRTNYVNLVRKLADAKTSAVD